MHPGPPSLPPCPSTADTSPQPHCGLTQKSVPDSHPALPGHLSLRVSKRGRSQTQRPGMGNEIRLLAMDKISQTAQKPIPVPARILGVIPPPFSTGLQTVLPVQTHLSSSCIQLRAHKRDLVPWAGSGHLPGPAQLQNPQLEAPSSTRLTQDTFAQVRTVLRDPCSTQPGEFIPGDSTAK